MLSVVVPSEPLSHEVKESLLSMEGMNDLEIIIVGLSQGASRSERLNIGFHRAKGSVILFHHPRSFMDPSGIGLLIERSLDHQRKPFWGGFTHQFAVDHPLLIFTSWYSNRIRSKRGIIYLDHGIFFDRRLWTRDLPKVDIFEDTLLSYEFRKSCGPEILHHTSTTSAIRFQKNGIFKQALVNQAIKIGFHLRISHAFMNRCYERGLDLNSKYSTNESGESS